MAKKSTLVFSFVFIFLLNFSLTARAETIKMKVVVVNPSETKTQTKSVKSYLPKEIRQKDVLDPAGLDSEYDSERDMFYVYKNDIELAPGEVKTFEIVLDDVWNIPDETLEDYKTRTERIVERLKDSSFYEQAKVIAGTIYGRLEEIIKSQNDPNATKQAHIASYRENVKILDSVKEDIERLEKMLTAVGGPPAPELLEKTELNLKSPNTRTTWVIIFVVLIFIGILSLTFYFTWHRQASITENIFTKEKESSFKEFKGGDQEKKE